MYQEEIEKYIQKINDDTHRLKLIVDTIGIRFEFSDGYCKVRTGGGLTHVWMSSNPKVSIEYDTWNAPYLSVGSDTICIKLSNIDRIELEQLPNETE